MTRWLIWGVLLAVTNGFSTLVSRARNTPDYGYHAFCAVLNHATWFLVNVMFVGVAIDIGAFTDKRAAVFAWGFYITWSTVGSVIMHYVSIKYLEKGNRRVGGYDDRRDNGHLS